MRGQTAVGLVVILSLSAWYLGKLSSSKSMAEEKNGVDDLAAAAKQFISRGRKC